MRGTGYARRLLMAALVFLTTATCRSFADSAARMEVRPGEKGVAIALVADGAATLDLTSFTLTNPPRLIFDIANVTLAPDQASTLAVGAAGIQQARVAQYQRDPSVVRLVLDLEVAEPPTWQRSEGGNPDELVVAFGEVGPVILKPPAITTVDGGVRIRLAGAGWLARRTASLSDPPRVYADLTGAELGDTAYREEYEEGLVSGVRMARQPAQGNRPVSRIVIELREPAPYSFYCEGGDLVVAIGAQPSGLPPPEYRPAGRLKGRTIVVDPGHGGKDIGAPARPGSPPTGPFEKDIVLDIASRLARLMKSEGAAVTMTRADDTFISLQGRAALANDLKADVFVSIHCNSYRTPNTLCGTSVYYDHPNSIELAKCVQEELVPALGTDDKGIRNANFAVIRRTTGPGILVETAFINHDGDRERLVNPNYRERAARAILQGVIRFLSQTPKQDNAEE